METVRLLDVPITMTSKEELLHRMKRAISYHHQLTCVAMNARKVIRYHEDKNMKDLIESFDIHIADGQSIVNALDKRIERITGVDLMIYICENAQLLNARIFLYGASYSSNQKAREYLEKTYPGILIVGNCDGFNDDDVIERINESHANVVFVGKGTPKQEQWIQEHKDHLCANVYLGVGGGFDILSGHIKRAPLWIQKLGLEWLYRMILEPKRFQQIPELLKFKKMINQDKKKKKGDIYL